MLQAEGSQREQVESPVTSLSETDILTQFVQLKQCANSAPYPSVDQRRLWLITLKKALIHEQQALTQALSDDYGYRSDFDSTICDLLPAVSHINYTLKHLKSWLKPSPRHNGLLLFPSKVKVHYQPLGVVGVIVPWNFPIVLSVAPIVTALAAGNRVMVKLSEYTPQTNQVLARIFSVVEEAITTVQGDANVAAKFSALAFDHLLFTGSTPVGKLVAQAAAKNLTPVTLELGGKSPVIIADDADLKRSVDNIMLGKAVNAGQICVAPDYVLVPQAKVSAFTELYLKRFKKNFTLKSGVFDTSHIINQTQFERLQSYLEDAERKGANIHPLQNTSDSSIGRQFLPHLITQVDESMLVTQQEIFGPILPVIGYQTLDDAIAYVNARPRPLALYLMTNDNLAVQLITTNTHSGGVAVNDTLLHVAADDAPFGGIGESGIGHYHGIEGFKVFSHAKTVLISPQWLPRSHWLLRYRRVFLPMLRRWFIR
ncbi:coniferyl aldehyde dehydrogenase [Vibrio aestuarianus]|uniref:coniferyl aldehyde dehydrogenase n=1 Tax=Vibrio aestuarianus TaxID=28171 RepID=UPI00237CF284|nr:coniferyl aldehyde dehydrogenase [Vibrio aestuarianus]MDE1331434.1 coniferyl aldehyde dehydrogenase [Vibrio aestuarianus]